MSYRMTFALPVAALLLAAPAFAQDSTDTTAPAGDAAQTETTTSDISDVLPLDESIRGTSETALQDTLYDLISLQHTTHQYHWNVVGTDFYQLHEFYGELYEGVGGYIDSTAERLLAIGVPADGTLTGSAEGSEIPAQAPVEFVEGTQATESLLPIYADFSSELYDRVEATSDDPVTQDFLIGIAYAIDKYTWQLRAHTQ